MESLNVTKRKQVNNTARSAKQSYVRICPHQIFSFPTFELITSLKEMKTGQFFDILSLLSLERHNDMVAEKFICKNVDQSGRNYRDNADAMAAIEYTPANKYEDDYFALNVTWSLQFEVESSRMKSQQAMTEFLSQYDIWLCPHK